MLGYHIPAPDEAMIISGAKGKSDDQPFRIVTGHGRFVVPVRSKVSYLSLRMQEAEVQEPCVTQQGITLSVKAVIAFKVGDDAASIANAARRFLADEDQMPRLTGRIFAGHLRSIVGSMTVEDLIRERQKLAEEVLDASKLEMAKLGLVVDSLQIESIDDQGSGYINALSQPHVAAVNQAARIAQAQADQAAAEAQQLSARNQADFARQTAIAQADYKAQVDQAQARSSQAGPLAAAQAAQEVLAEQAKVAERNAELRRQQLVAEVAAPAEAEAERIRTIARANADATLAAADAAAANGRVALDQQLIAMLPQLTDNLAAGLANANVTILDGATGYNNLVAELGAQAAAILGAIRAASNAAGGGAGQTSGQGPGQGAGPSPTNGTAIDRPSAS